MKTMERRVDKWALWVDRFFFCSLGLFFGYILLSLLTDIRADKIRPFATRDAVRQGVERGIEIYKREYTENEALMVRKRRARDAAIKRYIERLDKMMDMTRE